MTDWDEISQSEEPAVLLLQRFGWSYASTDLLDRERGSSREVILVPRLEAAIRRLNPWISDDNMHRVTHVLETVQASNLIEANQAVHTMLNYGVSVMQDTGDGLGMKNRTVQLLDYERPSDPTRNEFVFTRQFPVQNPKNLNIIPDLVLFVNGLPIAVIECKSPRIPDPIIKGIDQVVRYQELDDRFEDRGAPRLFHSVQVVACICGVKASYATVGTPRQFWAEWKIPHPLSLDEFQRHHDDVNAQSVLLYGLFRPDTLLDLIRNFIVFEVDDGRIIKKIARYQQFIAVDKAVSRILEASGKDRGGIVWHTQGSGKSLTMVFMALKLRRLPQLGNPTIVVVTDRTDLDRQITTTFTACGFPNPEQAVRIRHLRELLQSHAGKTILTTVQKFGGISEELTDHDNIFVMVDEAHRTQYKSLAARMRQALANACFLGFTGTPIDKKDRSTFATFGSYIHTYTIEEAVKDGATVPIYYESRLPELQILGENIDTIFDRVFNDRSPEEREEIKRRHVTEEAVASAPSRIRQVCLDLIDHFEKYIQPNGFKAQIVAPSREVAVSYKQNLDALHAPKSALIMSLGHNDPKIYHQLAVHKDQQKTVIEDQFKKKGDDLAILIVCDMLLTGFDAPIEQVMYLDSPLKEHTLLQAIARVNRRSDEIKTYGLIVDYWGVSRDLQKALEIFNPDDVQGALKPKSDELPRLEARHQTIMRLFQGLSRDDLEAALKVIVPEDVRAEFDQAFKRFSRSLDMVLPDPAGLRFLPDLRWLSALRTAARNRFRDDSINLSDCGEKVRKIIEEHVHTAGVMYLNEPVSIYSTQFDTVVDRLSSTDAKASEMEHALRHEISVRIEENPVFYRSLKERLEAIIDDKRQARIDAAKQLDLFTRLRDELRGLGNKASSLGMTEHQFAIYGILESFSYPQDKARELSAAILDTLSSLAVIDWQHKEDVQREMRRQIKRLIRLSGSQANVEELTSSILDLARVRL